MDMDHVDETTVDVDVDWWLDDVGEFLSGIGDSVMDFLTPDIHLEVPVDPASGDLAAVPAEGTELANDGFYQSMPGIDSVTGQILDDTYQLIDDIDEFGVDTFGQQAWDETMVAVHNDEYGLLEGIETPAEMQLRFAQDDAEAADRFSQWQSEQEAAAAISDSDSLIQDSEDLAWDTGWLLNRGW